MAPLLGAFCAGAIVILAIGFGLFRAGVFRPTMPIRVGRRCGPRDSIGLPTEFWLIFSNSTCSDHAVKLAIEYKTGKDLIEQVVIVPGDHEHRIPEPQRVRTIRLEMPGYCTLIVYL